MTGHRPALTSRTASDPIQAVPGLGGRADDHGLGAHLVGDPPQLVVRVAVRDDERERHAQPLGLLLGAGAAGPPRFPGSPGPAPRPRPPRPCRWRRTSSARCSTYTQTRRAPCRRASPAAYAPARREVTESSTPTRMTRGPSVPSSKAPPSASVTSGLFHSERSGCAPPARGPGRPSGEAARLVPHPEQDHRLSLGNLGRVKGKFCSRHATRRPRSATRRPAEAGGTAQPCPLSWTRSPSGPVPATDRSQITRASSGAFPARWRSAPYSGSRRDMTLVSALPESCGRIVGASQRPAAHPSRPRERLPRSPSLSACDTSSRASSGLRAAGGSITSETCGHLRCRVLVGQCAVLRVWQDGTGGTGGRTPGDGEPRRASSGGGGQPPVQRRGLRGRRGHRPVRAAARSSSS